MFCIKIASNDKASNIVLPLIIKSFYLEFQISWVLRRANVRTSFRMELVASTLRVRETFAQRPMGICGGAFSLEFPRVGEPGWPCLLKPVCLLWLRKPPYERALGIDHILLKFRDEMFFLQLPHVLLIDNGVWKTYTQSGNEGRRRGEWNEYLPQYMLRQQYNKHFS